jgi:signal transduction histidine kinase
VHLPTRDIGAIFARTMGSHLHGILIVERDPADELVIVWSNCAAAKRLGAQPGRPLATILDASVVPAWEAACRDVLARAASSAHESATFTSDGASVVIELRDDLGPHPLFSALLAQNTTGVFLATLEQPIEWGPHVDREATLDYVFDHLRVTAANDALCAQLHTPREELLGTAASLRWAPRRDEWRQHMGRLYDQGMTYHTVRAPRGDGTWIEVEGVYACVYDAGGRIVGHYGVQLDITQRRASAEALAKAQERLELAIVAGDLGVWDLDLASKSIHFEARWFERLGYDIESVQWRDVAWWASAIHPEDLGEAARSFREHLAGASELFRVECRIRTASEAWRWLLSTGKVTNRDLDGRPLRMVGTSLDITERKELHARLAMSERLAALGKLAASVGHEISNPLTYVVLNLRRIDDELARANLTGIRPLVEQAREGIDRVRGVVSDLQALSRVPEDRLTAVNPLAVIEQCLKIADHELSHRARIIRDLAPVPQVSGNESRLVQLFLNLIVNAAQAIPEGDVERHWVRVASRTSDDGRVVIEIGDSGVGIGPDKIERIFEPFFTTKREGDGIGLGLAIARSIVLSMRGEIGVDSAVGRGTTFRVTLPASTLVPAPAIARERVPAPATRPLRILVIDDEAGIGRIVQSLLDEHDVVVATSADAALARLRVGERFDRILCDLMMPQVTGMDFFGLIAPELRSTIVFVTGGAFTERARAFLAGIPNRVLRKPFDLDELTALLT